MCNLIEYVISVTVEETVEDLFLMIRVLPALPASNPVLHVLTYSFS